MLPPQKNPKPSHPHPPPQKKRKKPQLKNGLKHKVWWQNENSPAKHQLLPLIQVGVLKKSILKNNKTYIVLFVLVVFLEGKIGIFLITGISLSTRNFNHKK